MSTGRHLPQHTGHYLLADGTDRNGRRVEGNAVIVEPVEIVDPADLPLGGPVEPGLWGCALWVEDPGGVRVRTVGANDDAPLVLDPADVDEGDGPGAGDLFHLDVQYTEPSLPAAA